MDVIPLGLQKRVELARALCAEPRLLVLDEPMAGMNQEEKEYIALGMSVVLRCEPCINFHVEALMKAGATREELGDVLAMAVQMGGGPGLMYAGHALACWDELAAPAA